MRRINLLWLLPLLTFLLSACVVVQEGPTKEEKASKINVQLGMGYYRQGNLELANEKLLKALDQDPNSSQAHYAFAVLQNRFLDKEKAEFHFRKAIELDPDNSEALTNFGAFLCLDDRVEEAEQRLMQAVKNPLYRSPEVAYINAALCLKKADLRPEQTEEYLKKALGARTNYRPALIALAQITYDDGRYELTELYLKRFHLVGPPTARSLWLDIRNELATDNRERALLLAEKLRADFADSPQYKSWLELNNE